MEHHRARKMPGKLEHAFYKVGIRDESSTHTYHFAISPSFVDPKMAGGVPVKFAIAMSSWSSHSNPWYVGHMYSWFLPSRRAKPAVPFYEILLTLRLEAVAFPCYTCYLPRKYWNLYSCAHKVRLVVETSSLLILHHARAYKACCTCYLVTLCCCIVWSICTTCRQRPATSNALAVERHVMDEGYIPARWRVVSQQVTRSPGVGSKTNWG